MKSGSSSRVTSFPNFFPEKCFLYGCLQSFANSSSMLHSIHQFNRAIHLWITHLQVPRIKPGDVLVHKAKRLVTMQFTNCSLPNWTTHVNFNDPRRLYHLLYQKICKSEFCILNDALNYHMDMITASDCLRWLIQSTQIK